jgi:thiol-disulfide isomerase/thioredoxin
MQTRRNLLIAATIGAFGLTQPARAFEIGPYVKPQVDKIIASGKPVIIHVYAPWCLQCHAQAAILDSLKGDASYDKVAFFRVDYDGQQDIVAALNCPRSTVIAYKGGKEVGRMSWGTSDQSVIDVLKLVL